MEDTPVEELVTKLQQEKDWHKSTIFTDKGEVIASNKCQLLQDEIK